MLERAQAVLRAAALPGASEAAAPVSAERGYLREAGNLLFHISVIVVLVGFAYGQLFGYKGGAIVLVGNGFTNSLPQYDEFAPGSFFDPDDLPPLSFTVDDFEVQFLTEGPPAGQPVDFARRSATPSAGRGARAGLRARGQQAAACSTGSASSWSATATRPMSP